MLYSNVQGRSPTETSGEKHGRITEPQIVFGRRARRWVGGTREPRRHTPGKRRHERRETCRGAGREGPPRFDDLATRADGLPVQRRPGRLRRGSGQGRGMPGQDRRGDGQDLVAARTARQQATAMYREGANLVPRRSHGFELVRRFREHLGHARPAQRR